MFLDADQPAIISVTEPTPQWAQLKIYLLQRYTDNTKILIYCNQNIIKYKCKSVPQLHIKSLILILQVINLFVFQIQSQCKSHRKDSSPNRKHCITVLRFFFFWRHIKIYEWEHNNNNNNDNNDNNKNKNKNKNLFYLKAPFKALKETRHNNKVHQKIRKHFCAIIKINKGMNK